MTRLNVWIINDEDMGKMIPKIFHHVWVGSNPMPEKEIKYIESFRRHHPDWEFMFWIEDNISTLQMPQK